MESKFVADAPCRLYVLGLFGVVFDLVAANSLKNNCFHQQIDAAYYASPDKEGTAVNQLDVVILSALEIDANFNVNVLTGSIGGHPDTAAGYYHKKKVDLT